MLTAFEMNIFTYIELSFIKRSQPNKSWGINLVLFRHFSNAKSFGNQIKIG